ncbi:MAG: sigma-70 family RNA polymerase sigma factor [Pseudomonadota bacterium]|nr:sigma-70 family RNA polymerase sigma factor [Pseudomonadota bacterium]
MDIKALLKRIEAGDKQAFASVVDHFQRPLFGYLGRMGLSQGPAEEIAQETFLRAWRRLGDYDPGRAEFSTWLFTIARNLALNELSRAACKYEVVTGEMLPDVAGDGLQPAAALSEMQQRRRLHAALCGLAPTQRSALALAYFKELDLASIARIEGCSVGAIKVRLHRAKQQLRQLLEEDDG